MHWTRTTVTLVLAFLLGGSLAEAFLHTKHAVERQRVHDDEGSAGERIALEIQDASGETVARPRIVVVPGRAISLVLRDPSNPDRVRLTLRLETERQISG